MVTKGELKVTLLLKPGDLSMEDIVTIFASIIHPVLDYERLVWHYGLPEYQHKDIEGIRKRALIIFCCMNSTKSEDFRAYHPQRQKFSL